MVRHPPCPMECESWRFAQHLILSLHPEDNPPPEALRALVSEFLEHPYFAHHKAVSNIHWNEEHKHAHILINHFGDNGKKLSLSGTKLRELRRYLDRLCYARGGVCY